MPLKLVADFVTPEHSPQTMDTVKHVLSANSHQLPEPLNVTHAAVVVKSMPLSLVASTVYLETSPQKEEDANHVLFWNSHRL